MTTTIKKYCPSCKKKKELSAFYHAKNRKHGVEGYCKKCKLEKTKVYSKKWKQENVAYVRERNKKYRHANRDKVLKWRADYRKKHKKEIIEKAYIYIHRRRAVKLKASGSFIKKEWDQIKKAQDNTCLVCKRKEPEIVLCIDHIIPLSKKGSNGVLNIQGLCFSCNSSKGVKIISIEKLQEIILKNE